MTQDEINEAEWNKKENWSHLYYNSRLDNRLFVPRRRGYGQTMNMGHGKANFYLLGILAVVLSPGIIALVGLWIKGELK
ncbi:MAG: hypothetical protein ACREE6_19020 [Limisphaerales bacterium]